MPKELYLYSSINSWSAKDIISQMEDAGDDNDITMRIYSGGGDVFAGYGIIAKMVERSGKTSIKVDGMAASMAAIMLCFADNVECLDTSTIMLHRASGDTSTKEDKDFLDQINAKLREKLTSKIDDKELTKLTGVSIADLFEAEKRIDLFITPKQAKKIGLVDKVNTLSQKEVKAQSERMFAIAANYNPTDENPKPNIIMTIEKIKAEHPAVYAQILALGITEGVAQERDRVEAALVFNELDPKGVSAIIKAGKPLSQTQLAEFSLKAMSSKVVIAIKKDAAGNVITEEDVTAKTEKELALAEFNKALDSNLNSKK